MAALALSLREFYLVPTTNTCVMPSYCLRQNSHPLSRLHKVYYYLLHLLPMIIFTQMMSRVPNGIPYILVKKAAYYNLIGNLDTYSRY